MSKPIEPVFGVQGWFDGESDCEPPEPGKFWLEITENGEEIALVVHRMTGREDDEAMSRKAARAYWIAEALEYVRLGTLLTQVREHA